MPRAPRTQGQQYRAERRVANRDASARARRQAALADHPNQREFGQAEYIDDTGLGREYRVAFLHRLTDWTPGQPIGRRPLTLPTNSSTKLWIRIQRGTNAWPRPGEVLRLIPIIGGIQAEVVRVSYVQVIRHSQRTSFLQVTGFRSNQL